MLSCFTVLPPRLSTRSRAVLWTLLAIFLAIIVQRAWVAEDAYITFRTVDNFLHGFGLRWNPSERVQSYTHPLWMLVLLGGTALSSDPWLAAVGAGLVFSMATVWFGAFRLAATSAHACLFLASAATSFGFVDYSTSGLENSLAHLLLVLFAAACLGGAPIWRVSLLYALLCVNRLDHGLLCLPMLGVVALREVRTARAALELAAGFVPLIVWEAFSVFYYGFPFPNTAYAKLSNGVPPFDLAAQGLRYLDATAQGDPVAFWTIVAALLAAAWSRERLTQAAGIGIALYLAFLVKAGGDFMLGRLTSAPFVLALTVLMRIELPGRGNVPWLIACLAVVVLGNGSALPTWLEVTPDLDRPRFGLHHVADERSVYWNGTGIRFHERSPLFPEHPFRWVARRDLWAGRKVVYYTNVGIAGWAVGRRIHVIDLYALGDPLLARLPAAVEPWRSGHFRRDVPWGYTETLESGENKLFHENLRQYWTHLAAATRAPLGSPGRWAEILGLNTGRWDSLLAMPPPKQFALEALPEETFLAGEGILVHLGGQRHARQVEVRVDSNDAYHLRFFRQGTALSDRDIAAGGTAPSGQRTITLTVPWYARWRGYDAIRVVPREGDGKYSAGRIRLLD